MDQTRIVLVVEDDASIAQTTRALFEESGYPVFLADSVDSALDYLNGSAESVAALFSDVRLRGTLDGTELAAFVAVRWPWIALCVTSGVELERPSRLPDGARFIAKPWAPDEVMLFLQRAFSKA